MGTVLKSLGVGPEALFSTLGRIAARCVETVLLTEKIDTWVDALAANMDKGDLRIHDTGKWDPSSWPKEAFGAGFHEAPRGALGHWVHIKDGVIAELPVHRPQHLERRAPRRLGEARALRGRAARRPRWRIPSSRWRSSAPSTPSIPAWPVGSTWWTWNGGSWPE